MSLCRTIDTVEQGGPPPADVNQPLRRSCKQNNHGPGIAEIPRGVIRQIDSEEEDGEPGGCSPRGNAVGKASRNRLDGTIEQS